MVPNSLSQANEDGYVLKEIALDGSNHLPLEHYATSPISILRQNVLCNDCYSVHLEQGFLD